MEILRIGENSRLISRAAAWFNSKWSVPAEEYEQSMRASETNGGLVPQWYVAVEGDEIVGGVGVIENDFHVRKDLAPNVCSLYVEEKYRSRGIAGELLRRVCDDMSRAGIDTLYLITDHTSFYERYGWTFLCMTAEEGGSGEARMYVHREPRF